VYILIGTGFRYVYVVHENVGFSANDRVPTSRYFSGNGLERIFSQHQGNITLRSDKEIFFFLLQTRISGNTRNVLLVFNFKLNFKNVLFYIYSRLS
jgi:hypothetical protein